jgi:hypothetical protein
VHRLRHVQCLPRHSNTVPSKVAMHLHVRQAHHAVIVGFSDQVGCVVAPDSLPTLPLATTLIAPERSMPTSRSKWQPV